MVSREAVFRVLPLSLLVIGFFYYTHNFPSIFDVGLWDDSYHMSLGQASASLRLAAFVRGLGFSDYENHGLYVLFFRAVSLFVVDPTHLFMASGMLLLFGVYFSGVLAVFLLSRNSIVTVLVAAFLVFSGALLTEPRIIFLAMTIISLGTPLALSFSRIYQKTSILMVTAFLVTFVRPEFIVSFYLLLILAAASFLFALWGRMRKAEKSSRPVVGDGIVIPALSFAGILTLSIAWSFPILSANPYTFYVFGQDYSVRYVEEVGLTINPFLNWKNIMASEFPDADTVVAAFRLAPHKVLSFFAANFSDLIAAVLRSIGHVVLYSPIFTGATLAVLIVGSFWRLAARVPAAEPPLSTTSRGALYGDLVLIAIFAVPTILVCVFFYPENRFVILLEMIACLIVARLWRGFDFPFSSGLGTAFAAGFLLLIKPLPPIDQPTVKIINALRSLPPIKDMLETDGGWCWYLEPRCTPHFLAELSNTELETMLDDRMIDAIMVSPEMRRYNENNPNAALSFLFGNSSGPGWLSYRITEGYSILYRLPLARPGGARGAESAEKQ